VEITLYESGGPPSEGWIAQMEEHR
jgi:hypothetical protein